MNRKDLIRIIELKTYIYPDEPPKGGFGPTIAYKKGFNSCAEWAINLIEQLDEPEKPIVKQFVADWFEEHKYDLNYSIWEACVNSNAKYDAYEETTGNQFYDWLITAGGKDKAAERIETLVLMKEGYEVEKEPLFLMPVPCVQFPVHYCVDEDGKVSYRQGNAQKFTQEELDKYFPEIKQFAVPVEVDEQ